MSKLLTMNLEIFGENDKDFFTKAFEESYNIGEEENIPSEDVEDTENGSEVEDEQTIVDNEEKPENATETPEEEVEEKQKELTPQEIKELYEQYYGSPQEKPIQNETPQIDEQTQSALELYKFLEENPHLVQAMREVDQNGYEQINSYVPDEMTRKMQEFEAYIEEQQFNAYVNEVKSKYEDFDEDKVLEYAEAHDVYDLEVAYKAMKADELSKGVDEKALREELRKQIKNELLEELKQNSLSTQTIVGTQTEKPIENDKPTLSPKQNRIAKAMGMSAEEYSKWI